MRELDLVSLRYFLSVCETGSLSRAASREHVVVSAVSKRLAQLEGDFGVALIERGGKRGVTLTPAGETLMDQARAILANARRISDDMAAFEDGIRGKVHLLASVSAIAESLPDDVAAFMQLAEHREIQVDIEEEVSRDIVRRIRDGTARLGVLWDGTDLGDLACSEYRGDHLAVVVHADHPLANKRRCTFLETLDWDHVGLDPASAANQMQARVAAVAGRRMRYRAVVSNFDSALRVVRANLGISIIPREIAQAYADIFSLRVIPLSDPWAKRRMVIVRRAEEPVPKAASLLLNFLAQVKSAAKPANDTLSAV